MNYLQVIIILHLSILYCIYNFKKKIPITICGQIVAKILFENELIKRIHYKFKQQYFALKKEYKVKHRMKEIINFSILKVY